MAKSKRSAYDHSSEIAGVPRERDPATEHQESARGEPNQPNELDIEERRKPDGYGPRTHEPTRVTRKDGA